MGFLAKSATTKRVVPIGGQLNVALTSEAGPWIVTGGVSTEALVRSALMELNLTGLQSSTARDSTTALAAVFTPSFDSLLWVGTDNLREWSFILGALRPPDGIAADWQIVLEVNPATQSVIVGTKNYLTNNDELIHGSEHDALRNTLLSVLTRGQASDESVEPEVCAASLRLRQRLEDSPTEETEISFQITIGALAVDDTMAALEKVGLPVRSKSVTQVTWPLGTAAQGDSDNVTISYQQGAVLGRAQITSTSLVRRRLAGADLRACISRSLFVLRAVEPTAIYSGPAQWIK